LGEGATSWAQGGIAAVLEQGDSFDAHVNDTMIAGAGLNDLKVVEHVVEAAPRAIQHLIELGVPFASENGALHLTREGGHSHRRIVHVADATGWAIQQALEGAAAKHPTSRWCRTWSRSTSSPAATRRISRPAARCTGCTPGIARPSGSRR